MNLLEQGNNIIIQPPAWSLFPDPRIQWHRKSSPFVISLQCSILSLYGDNGGGQTWRWTTHSRRLFASWYLYIVSFCWVWNTIVRKARAMSMSPVKETPPMPPLYGPLLVGSSWSISSIARTCHRSIISFRDSPCIIKNMYPTTS